MQSTVILCLLLSFLVSPLLAERFHSGDPTNDEQYYVELINRYRADPLGETMLMADSVSQSMSWLRSDVGSDVILRTQDYINRGCIEAAPPVSFQHQLITAARLHSEDMAQQLGLILSHQSIDPPAPLKAGMWPVDRAKAVGFEVRGSYAENVATGQNPERAFQDFVVDRGSKRNESAECFLDEAYMEGIQNPAEHQLIISDPRYQLVGIGTALLPNIPIGSTFHAVTMDFFAGDTPSGAVTGVAMVDANDDGFYQPGEGLTGIKVTAGTADFAITSASGGYSLPLDPGTYTVRFSGNDVESWETVIEINDANVKVDFLGIASARKPFLEGDADLDGDVDFSDFLALSDAFGGTAAWYSGDFDRDGVAGFADFLLLTANFGRDSVSSVSVPETNCTCLCMLAVCVLVHFRAR